MIRRAYQLDTKHMAVVEQRASGIGVMLWVGELRLIEDDQPIRAWGASETPTPGANLGYPVTVGPDEQDVLDVLAQRLRDRQAHGL